MPIPPKYTVDDVVTVVEVNQITRNTGVFNAQHRAKIYYDNKANSSYIIEEFVFAFPRASGEALGQEAGAIEEVILIKPSRSIVHRVARFESTRIGQNPEIPAAETVNPDEVLCRREVTPTIQETLVTTGASIVHFAAQRFVIHDTAPRTKRTCVDLD